MKGRNIRGTTLLPAILTGTYLILISENHPARLTGSFVQLCAPEGYSSAALSSGFHHPRFAVTAFRTTRFHQRIPLYFATKMDFGQTHLRKVIIINIIKLPFSKELFKFGCVL